jgi:guanine deaminase
VSRAQTILGPILNPRADGWVDFHREGALSCNSAGKIDYIGFAEVMPAALRSRPAQQALGVIAPPFLDAHIHIPQHPIRGRFVEGVGGNPPEGRLLAGLNRNVFPTEARCADEHVAEQVVEAFLADTLANGVVGGSAYMTTHPAAVRVALRRLPMEWSVGLVLMNQNCPEALCTNEATLDADIQGLARDFGDRFIVTDRFAVAVSTPLRKRAAALAKEHGLRMQTHLNEQLREKAFVERELYPSYDNYTDVYLRDGLLDRDPILAHCVRMSPEEFDAIARKHSSIAHCPTSNTLLGSGIMPLNEVVSRGIEYAICTDVGASPTVSMLAEMAQFVKCQGTRSDHATPQEALVRSTSAPARIMHLDRELGTFEVGKPLSLIEIESEPIPPNAVTGAVIMSLLGLVPYQLSPNVVAAFDTLQRSGLDAGPELAMLEQDVTTTARRLENKVLRVTMRGSVVYNRPTPGGS